MPVEVSIVQAMSLGALCVTVIFQLALLLVAFWVFRKAIGVVSRFQSVGAERVNGRIQMRGLFHEEAERRETLVAAKPGLFSVLKEAADFEPTAEDLQRVAQVERNAAGAGGEVN